MRQRSQEKNILPDVLQARSPGSLWDHLVRISRVNRVSSAKRLPLNLNETPRSCRNIRDIYFCTSSFAILLADGEEATRFAVDTKRYKNRHSRLQLFSPPLSIASTAPEFHVSGALSTPSVPRAIDLIRDLHHHRSAHVCM